MQTIEVDEATRDSLAGDIRKIERWLKKNRRRAPTTQAGVYHILSTYCALDREQRIPRQELERLQQGIVNWLWHIISGPRKTGHPAPVQKAILRLLEHSAGPVSTGEIAKTLRKSTNNVTQRLRVLQQAGKITRVGPALYIPSAHRE